MSMPLIELVRASREIAATRGRKRKIAAIAAVLARATADEVAQATAWLAGEVPQGALGVGPAMLTTLAATPPAGAATLTLDDVGRCLTEVAGDHGAGRDQRRRAALATLFARATADEADFLRRLLGGDLRQGALAGLVLEAVATTYAAPLPATRRAVMLAGGVPPVAEALAKAGTQGLAGFALTPFQPVLPMLADTAEDLGAALDRFAEAVLEYKLDGARVQVHKHGDRIAVFSRGQNDVTAAVPEVVEFVRSLPARTLILDGEVIARDAAGRPLPFQVTMRRFGRRHDVESLRRTLPLDVAFFDLLRAADDVLMDAPLRDRWAALHDALRGERTVPRLVTRAASAANSFHAEAIASGHEGLMIKNLGAPYEAGRRGTEWLKLKSVHTLDLVVLAAEWGNGRRAGWLSNLHLGARDPHSGGFVMLGKTFKGMTDATLRWQTEQLLARELERRGPVVHVRPDLVVEIACNDVQRSPYPGGVALRFARLVRYRPDKSAASATTIDEVRALLPRVV